jgi:Bifunctional DNA primase/polymerase, N-terminal
MSAVDQRQAQADMLPWVLAAAARDWHVFPVRPRDKRPAVPDHTGMPGASCARCGGPHRGWEQRATADPAVIRAAWSGRWRGAPYGIACGPSGLLVIDLDAHKPLPDDWQQRGARNGIDALTLIARWAGQDVPATFTVRTPSGGLHLYFREPPGMAFRNTAAQLAPQVDTRGHGGYVVGPGSAIGGRAYEVTDARPVVMLPPWLARLLTPPPPPLRPVRGTGGGNPDGRLAALVRAVEMAPDGQLNNTLHWAACRVAEMVAAGQADEPGASAELLAAAVSAGHPEPGAARTIASGLRKAGTR